MKVEIYSDVACPWCYVGKARFERALSAFPRPATSRSASGRSSSTRPAEQAQSLYEYYDERFGPGFRDNHTRVSDIAAQEGLEFHLDRALAVNTLTAHRLLMADRAALRRRRRQRDLKAALMRTYFSDGGDVNDTDTLVRLAEGVGVDADRGPRLADQRRRRRRGPGRAERSARELGIKSVPTFVFEGKCAVQGAQDASTFLQVLEQVAAEHGHSRRRPSGSDDAGLHRRTAARSDRGRYRTLKPPRRPLAECRIGPTRTVIPERRTHEIGRKRLG